ncbi:SpoIIE family protein phosphatase [Nocardioides sp. GXQ0305]|uniref:SpoIIE family protein phosphatase n=1 Tax=Nocardioides sp. GXQ0305 TaxID=3423912 RepID=UPI003D7E3625
MIEAWDGSEAAVAAFDQAPRMFSVSEGPDHVLRAVNGALRHRFRARPDPVGRPVSETLGDLADRQLLQRYDEVYETGRPYRAREWRLVAAEDPMLDVYLDIELSPWLREDGSVRGVIALAVDVTRDVRERVVHQGADHRSAHVEASALVTALQDALLPSDVPVLPCVDIGARYLLADATTAAGGDWFDAVPRTDGTVALVVGDVVGHGVAASTTMGQLRSVLRERLLAGATLTEGLSAVDRFAGRVPEARTATACVVELDPVTGSIEYCTAGHPPPLVVTPSGSTRFLEPTGAGPLVTHGDFPTACARLDPGDLVLLYSDGLVERPGRSLAQNTLDLARVASEIATGRTSVADVADRVVERVCDGTLDLLTRVTGYADDITLLAAQRVARAPALTLRTPARPDSVAEMRQVVGEWLDVLGVGLLDHVAVEHALGEAVANAVEHAYVDLAPAAGVRLRVALEDDGMMVAEVSDSGRWRERPTAANRGHGLSMVSGMADSVTVETGGEGTSLIIRHRLTRPARMLRGDTVPTGSERDTHEYTEHRDHDVLTVSGPVDLRAASRLRIALQRLLRAGTADGTVDLTRVTHLGSAGVQALHEALSTRGGRLRIVAPPGSPAQHVLELVRLPFSSGSEDPAGDEDDPPPWP